jgi:hypothetical protein
MTRSFGSHAKSEFDRTLSCGFDMPSDAVRRTAVKVLRARSAAQRSLVARSAALVEVGQRDLANVCPADADNEEADTRQHQSQWIAVSRV